MVAITAIIPWHQISKPHMAGSGPSHISPLWGGSGPIPTWLDQMGVQCSCTRLTRAEVQFSYMGLAGLVSGPTWLHQAPAVPFPHSYIRSSVPCAESGLDHTISSQLYQAPAGPLLHARSGPQMESSSQMNLEMLIQPAGQKIGHHCSRLLYNQASFSMTLLGNRRFDTRQQLLYLES